MIKVICCNCPNFALIKPNDYCTIKLSFKFKIKKVSVFTGAIKVSEYKLIASPFLFKCYSDSNGSYMLLKVQNNVGKNKLGTNKLGQFLKFAD